MWCRDSCRFFASGSVGAEERGDPRAGLAFASANCAGCHAVGAADDTSPNFYAPPFTNVAKTPGMTGRALAVWLQTSHPTRIFQTVRTVRARRDVSFSKPKIQPNAVLKTTSWQVLPALQSLCSLSSSLSSALLPKSKTFHTIKSSGERIGVKSEGLGFLPTSFQS